MAPSLPTDSILFRCHACRQKYAVEGSRVGTRTKCKKCQVVMQVPKVSSLDNPEASKPTVHVAQAEVKSASESIEELSFDAVGGEESVVVDDPKASAVRHAHENDPPSGIAAPEMASGAASQAADKRELFDASPATDSGVKEAAAPKASQEASKAGDAPKAPPGKKLCPSCHHACPSMALACPLCQHRFELPKPKPRPVAEPAAAVATDSGIASGIGSGVKSASSSGIFNAGGKDGAAESKSGIKPVAKVAAKKDAGKLLDDLVTDRNKKNGRPVEAPMWMDEVVYGSAIKMGFAGLCCLAAGVIVFIQLDTPESSRNAFFLIKWAYAIGSSGGHFLGRLLPTLLCLGGGAAFLYFAIRPVVESLKQEQAARLADQAEKIRHAATLMDE